MRGRWQTKRWREMADKEVEGEGEMADKEVEGDGRQRGGG